MERHRTAAKAGLHERGITGYMEVRFALSRPKPQWSQRELLEAAERAQIHTFGWPIGVVAPNGGGRPRPTSDGIVAEVVFDDYGSYDYWCLSRRGDFYLLKSLFEDKRGTGTLFFSTRIVRVTETLLYCGRLYSRLNTPTTTAINIGLPWRAERASAGICRQPHGISKRPHARR